MNYQLLSLIENHPEGFHYIPLLSQKDVRRWPFALLAANIQAADTALSPFGDGVTGIIVTIGNEYDWQECAPLLFHLTVPHERQNELAGLIHSHLQLLEKLQRAENRSTAQTLNLLRACEEALRNKQDFKLVKDSLMEELTEQRSAEEALTNNNSFLHVLMNAIPVPVFYKDEKLRYLGINKSFESFYGTTNQEMLGKSVFDVAPRELAEIYYAKDMELILHPGQQIYESQIKNASGELREVIFHKATFCDSAGNIGGMVGAILDITERKEREKEQLKTEKLESLGVLAGGIAHDFNNILTGIMGNISFAQMFLDTTHKSYKPLAEAEKASVRASELALQLLTFARGGEPVKKIVSLEQILNETISLVLHGSNVKGDVQLPADIHAVEADEGQLCQMLQNIIINATQAMPGGGTVTVSGDNTALDENNDLSLPPGPYIRLTFTDQGCGIPDDILKKIFDPYFTTKSAGNGLGLASVYSIISRHGGHIGVTSKVGSGSTFTIHLPSTGATYFCHSSGSATLAAGNNPGDHILVMDDEEIIRDMTTEMLEYLGYKASTCENGKEAVTLYKTSLEAGTPFSAAVLDLTIPGGMGGKEAAAQILEIDPKAKLIVSSGYSSDPIMSDFDGYGFTGAVAKPYNIGEFGELLSMVVSRI